MSTEIFFPSQITYINGIIYMSESPRLSTWFNDWKWFTLYSDLQKYLLLLTLDLWKFDEVHKHCKSKLLHI